MIDYLSRKVYVTVLFNKRANTILEFIKSVYKELKFKKLLSDNGKEFNNTKLEEWCKRRNNTRIHNNLLSSAQR